jgi:curved DNA-binding protein CbpA
VSTFYEALGLSPGADEGQIKTAYRSLARRFHPDLNAGNAVGAERLAGNQSCLRDAGEPRGTRGL